MLFIENIKLAVTSIKSNKMRSFLTMLGIIIGISSVIAITSIGDSAKATVSKEFENLKERFKSNRLPIPKIAVIDLAKKPEKIFSLTRFIF